MAADLLELNKDLPAPTGLTIEHVEDTEGLRDLVAAGPGVELCWSLLGVSFHPAPADALGFV